MKGGAHPGPFALRASRMYANTPMSCTIGQRSLEHDNTLRECALAQNLEFLLESWVREQMTKSGLTEDPLVAHGLSLGKA